jgi:hypothetical protein
MKRPGRPIPYFLFALVFLTVACATTKLTESWRDEGFRGAIGKTVVIGVFKEPDTRKIFEDEFADRLRARGMDAVASHKIITDAELPDKDLVLRKIRNTGADAVFVTRLVDMEMETTRVPGRSYYVPRYYADYGTYYTHIYEPGYTVREGYAYAETNLYDVRNGKLIWSGHSTTTLSRTRYELIQAFVKVIIEKLSAEGLIR